MQWQLTNSARRSESNMKKPLNHYLISLLFFLALAGCHSMHQDGPPLFPRNIDRIPDAVPKIEKISHRGNKPYKVFGKQYYPLSSSKHYKESGLASWYGTKFHGNATSSGERYDLYAMTAAHRTLAFDTMVRVCRTDTGACVTVRINDRGPASWTGRVIDLSQGAADVLGMVRRGVAQVCLVWS